MDKIVSYLKAGAIEGLFKAIKIIPYLVGAMILAGLLLYVDKDQKVSWEAIKFAMLGAGANVLIVFLREWLPAK
jgi:hypothetical protein